MIETNYEKRSEAFRQAEALRDKVVLDVLAGWSFTVQGERTPIGGADAQYIVERNGNRFQVIDCARIPLARLASHVHSQLEKALARR